MTADRILIVGGPGSGKSTLASTLAQATGLPLTHLDVEYWRPGWDPTPQDEWRQRVPSLVAGDRWIVEGNFEGSLDLRLPRAQLVIVLHLSRRVRMWRIVRRTARRWGRSRPDLAPGCPERLDRAFLRWAWNFDREEWPRLLHTLEVHGAGVEVVTLRSPVDVSEWLGNVVSNHSA